MIELLVIIGGIVGFVYLNGRITKLEQKLSDKKPTELLDAMMPEQAAAVRQAVATAPQSIPAAAPNAAVPVAAATPEAAAGFDEASGGKWLGWLGIGAVFVGVAFFLKYAFDNNLITPQGRVVLGTLAGIIFIGAGQSLRKKYLQFAYLLIGGGAALLYLSFFAAYSLYTLLSQPAAFALMVAVTAAVVVLSVVDDSMGLAILAAVGGFGTSYMLGSGQVDAASLLSYIAILDVALVALAVWKEWTPLIYTLFIGTGLQYSVWYSAAYTPSLLPLAFFFLTMYFLIFLVIPIANLLLNRGITKEEDIGLVSLNALGYFLAAYGLLNLSYHDSIWMFALLLGAVYYIFAYVAHTLNKDDHLLPAYYFGIATICVTIAIPLKLEHAWIELAWLLESALLYGVAYYYKRPNLEVFGAVVYFIGAIKLFWDYISRDQQANPPFFNQYFLLFLLAIGIAYAITYLYSQDKEKREGSSSESLMAVFFFVANALSVFILTTEISAMFDQQIRTADLVNQKNTVISILWSVYSVLLIAVGFGARVRMARVLGLAFFFVTALKVFIDIWSLGEIYRIVASIVFGAIALLASFMYVRYSKRIKEMIY